MNEPIFKTAHRALTFAYNHTNSTLDRPLMSRLADKVKRTGKGLAGIDGATQAGMIQAMMASLTPLAQSIIIARYAPQEFPCACGAACCSGYKANFHWHAAVRHISDNAAAQALSGHLTARVVRDGLVARYFGQKVHLQTLAKRGNVHPNTMTHHNALIVNWLKGTIYTKKGNKREAGELGQEQIAMAAAEALLIRMGVVGDDAP